MNEDHFFTTPRHLHSGCTYSPYDQHLISMKEMNNEAQGSFEEQTEKELGFPTQLNNLSGPS